VDSLLKRKGFEKKFGKCALVILSSAWLGKTGDKEWIAWVF
jgi:hypothetical protein